jgi:hypothetical protein
MTETPSNEQVSATASGMLDTIEDLSPEVDPYDAGYVACLRMAVSSGAVARLTGPEFNPHNLWDRGWNAAARQLAEKLAGDLV